MSPFNFPITSSSLLTNNEYINYDLYMRLFMLKQIAQEIYEISCRIVIISFDTCVMCYLTYHFKQNVNKNNPKDVFFF